MEEFIRHIQEALDTEALFKLTLSKPKMKSDSLKNIFIRPIQHKGEVNWKVVFRHKTNDQTKIHSNETLISSVKSYLNESFQNADLFLEEKKITLLQSKKGKSNVLAKKEVHKIEIEDHDHHKKRLIPESIPFLIDLGISSTNGKVFGHAQDKYKQINRYVELLSQLIKDDDTVKTVFDMGSGKGYLTFALHDYLSSNTSTKVNTTGVEIREDLVKKCTDIAQKHDIKGLFFEQGSIDNYTIKNADLVIALHACDIATDMAIAKGLEAESKYIVVAPCCHKQIRKAMRPTESSLNPLLQHGILKERQAEMITDTIRALLLEAKGYEVKVFEFISSEHTGKNIMLTARKTAVKKNSSLEKIKALKEEFGIETHYLETLVSF